MAEAISRIGNVEGDRSLQNQGEVSPNRVFDIFQAVVLKMLRLRDIKSDESAESTYRRKSQILSLTKKAGALSNYQGAFQMAGRVVAFAFDVKGAYSKKAVRNVCAAAARAFPDGSNFLAAVRYKTPMDIAYAKAQQAQAKYSADLQKVSSTGQLEQTLYNALQAAIRADSNAGGQ